MSLQVHGMFQQNMLYCPHTLLGHPKSIWYLPHMPHVGSTEDNLWPICTLMGFYSCIQGTWTHIDGWLNLQFENITEAQPRAVVRVPLKGPRLLSKGRCTPTFLQGLCGLYSVAFKGISREAGAAGRRPG